MPYRMTKKLQLLFFLFIPTLLSAQSVQGINGINTTTDTSSAGRFVTAFYFEAAGNGLAGSINLEEKFLNVATLRVGVGGFGRVEVHTYENSNATHNSYIWKPVFVFSSSYLLFGPEKFLELGLGVTIQPPSSQGYAPYIPDNEEAILPTMTIGFRYHPIESGFMFRVCFTPFIANDLSQITPWGGISIGHSF
jgi:hypothetical protein